MHDHHTQHGRRHQLHAGDEAAAHGADAVQGAEIEQKGCHGADDDDAADTDHGGYGKSGRGVPGLEEEPGAHAADEQRPACDGGSGIFFQQAHRQQGVERHARRGDGAPHEALGGDGQGAEVAVGGDEKHTCQHQRQRQQLHAPRQAVAADTVDQ